MYGSCSYTYSWILSLFHGGQANCSEPLSHRAQTLYYAHPCHDEGIRLLHNGAGWLLSLKNRKWAALVILFLLLASRKPYTQVWSPPFFSPPLLSVFLFLTFVLSFRHYCAIGVHLHFCVLFILFLFLLHSTGNDWAGLFSFSLLFAFFFSLNG